MRTDRSRGQLVMNITFSPENCHASGSICTPCVCRGPDHVFRDFFNLFPSCD
jgi:hypothetical protein